jgi:sugar lactone lactonase YvrE
MIAVADTYNVRIRLVVVATGAVSTLAGSGSDDYADGTGAAASFNLPMGVAFSPDQIMIAVADSSNNRIRRVRIRGGCDELQSAPTACGPTGAVTTLAGSDSAAGSADRTYTNSVAFSPDQTMIAVADAGNNRIRLVVVATGNVSTLAGGGSDNFADGTGAAASFNMPNGVAFSPDQTKIAVADTYNKRIRLVVVATGAVSTLAGGGSASYADGTGAAASFNMPNGVAFSPDQTLLAVSDRG